MKKQLLLLSVFIIFCSSLTCAQIPNGGFENWTIGTNGFLHPDGYQCSNDAHPGASILQGAGYTGNYCVQFASAYDSTTGDYEPGMLRLVHQPFPAISNPTTLSGFWRTFNPNITDALGLELHLYDASNMEVGTGDINTPFTGSIPNWTPFSIPIHYTSANPVTNFSLDILWILLSNDPNTYGELDDLTFDTGTSGITNGVRSNESIHLLPMDGNGRFLIQPGSNFQDQLTLDICDLSGKIVQHQNVSKANSASLELNISALSQGLYICNFYNNEAKISLKIVKGN